MKKAFVLFLALVIIALPVFAQGIESSAKIAGDFGRQYDAGEINYLQLQVQLNFLRESLYRKFFGQDYYEEQGKDFEQDPLFSLFRQAEKAFFEEDFEKLDGVLLEIELEFKNRNEDEALKVLNGIRQALQEKNYSRVEELGKKLESIFREEERSSGFSGWSKEKVQELLGEPTGFQDRVWVENRNRDERVKEPLPYWQKTIFDGQKIRVTVNAWPNVSEYSDKTVAYYWVNFEAKLKTQTDSSSTKEKIALLKQRVLNYFETGLDGEKIAEEIVLAERELDSMLREQLSSCNEKMLELFGEKKGIAKKIFWQGILFENDRMEFRLKAEENPSGEWHNFHAWTEAEFFAQQNNWFVQGNQALFDQLHSKTADELSLELKRTAAELKQSLSFGNLEKAKELSATLQEIVSVLSNKANSDNTNYSPEQLSLLLEEIFSQNTTGFKKEQVTSTEYQDNWIKESEQKSFSYCRGEEKWCGEGMSCYNAQCVSAVGGKEHCDNGIDDDSDNVIDCEDPDCTEFLACGRMCESSCSGETGCWQCNSEKCGKECNACGKCNQESPNNPEACNAVCSECGSCTKAFCSDKCDSCWSCENKYYGDGCYDSCKECDNCRENNRGDCDSLCVSCNSCRFEKGQIECPPGKAFSPQTGQCACPILECPEGYFLNQDNCGCSPVQQTQNPPQEQQQAPPTDQPVPPPEQQPPGCAIQCPEGQKTDLEKCECISLAGNQNKKSKASFSEEKQFPFSPLFPSIATGFGVLSEVEEEKENEFSCENYSCNPNQYCNSENGYCECQTGFFDCDGDWLNGCESSVQCSACSTDADCAQTRCSDNRLSVQEFRCVQGDNWEEVTAEFNFSAGCEQTASGELRAYAWIGGWGERLKELDSLKQQAYQSNSNDWCEKELETVTKQRIELQNSLNKDFEQWFAKEFASRTDAFRFSGEAMFLVHDAFQRNADETARIMRCLNRKDWPQEYAPANFSFETASGKTRIWEDFRQTRFWDNYEQQILSPYMEAWFFPTKEEFKQMFREDIAKEGPKGPSPIEIAMMRKNPKVMQTIEKISDSFGGEAKILLSIDEDSENIAQMLLTVNRDVLVRMEFPKQQIQIQDLDAIIRLDFGFFYDTMSTLIKDLEGSHTQKPYWEQQEFSPPEIDDALIIIGLFSRIIFAIPTGVVSVEPASAIPQVIFTLTDLISLIQLGQ